MSAPSHLQASSAGANHGENRQASQELYVFPGDGRRALHELGRKESTHSIDILATVIQVLQDAHHFCTKEVCRTPTCRPKKRYLT